MSKETNPAIYKKYAFILFGVAALYLFFAIGDVVVKGYSTLPSYPFIGSAVMGGVFLGYYIKAKKTQK